MAVMVVGQSFDAPWLAHGGFHTCSDRDVIAVESLRLHR
jgi:hypothetical protein